MTSVVALIARTATALDAITRWWPLTNDPPRADVSQAKRPHGPRLPVSTEVLSLRRAVVDELASLALEVAEELDLRPGIDTSDVPTTAAWLRIHHEWIATGSSDPEHTVAALEHHARRLEQTAKGERARVVQLRTDCPHCDHGHLVSSVAPGSDIVGSTIWCDHPDCAAQWSVHEARAVWRAALAKYGPSLRRRSDTPQTRRPAA